MNLIEETANKIRRDEKARKDFCNRVGISEDEFFINQNGDFEIEDVERAFQRGKLAGEAESKSKAKEIIKSLIADLFHLFEHAPQTRGHKTIWDDICKAQDFIKEK